MQLDTTQGNPSPLFKLSTVVGCATVGTPTSGTFGIDYSQGTAAITTDTDLVLATNTTVTSALKPFGLNHVGNLLHITAGASWTVGWYEIVSVSGVTATIDRAAGAAPLAGGTFYVGGAMSLNSTLDDEFFEIMTATNGTGANRIFVKNGTFMLGEAVSISAAGGTQAPIVIEGYNSLRGDTPTTNSTSPILVIGANTFGLGAQWDIYNMITTGTAANMFTPSTASHIVNCFSSCSSVTAGRNGININ